MGGGDFFRLQMLEYRYVVSISLLQMLLILFVGDGIRTIAVEVCLLDAGEKMCTLEEQASTEFLILMVDIGRETHIAKRFTTNDVGTAAGDDVVFNHEHGGRSLEKSLRSMT